MTRIRQRSMFEIGAVVTVLVAVVTCTAWIVRTTEDLRLQIKQIVKDNYTMSSASEDALREAIANPGHRVPDPRNPGQIFEAEKQEASTN